jgi:hypothetical protein
MRFILNPPKSSIVPMPRNMFTPFRNMMRAIGDMTKKFHHIAAAHIISLRRHVIFPQSENISRRRHVISPQGYIILPRSGGILPAAHVISWNFLAI